MALRDHNIDRLADTVFDVAIVGGGINGAVSAAALTARGASVALIDRSDFAGFTSQQSSNLVWGGIKYMESLEFSLVRDLCLSRNELMRAFPSAVREIRFLTTVPRGFRHHPLKLWAGTWLYWLMGNCFTRIPRYMSRREVERLEPAVRTDVFAGSFEYSDAYLFDNDARFVFNFVRAALDRGGVAANYVESLGAERREGVWRLRARDRMAGREMEIRARVLINAAGAFVDEHNGLSGQRTGQHHVLSKGIHLLVDRVTSNERVLAFFADDGRLFFVIPMGSKTCLGTTDTRVTDPLSSVTDDDRRFVLDNINRCLRLERPLTTADIIAERCGVRPLVVRCGEAENTDFLQLSRRHDIESSRGDAHLSIFGGKLTDCINIGEEVCEEVAGMGVALSAGESRWYGEPTGEVRDAYFRRARRINLDRLTAAHCIEPLTGRLWRRYGAKATELLARIEADPEQAHVLIQGTEYVRAEISLAAEREMIVTLEDFLRRRSKIALMLRPEEIRHAGGLMQACRILFGKAAQERLHAYFNPRNDTGAHPGGADRSRETMST